MASSLSPGVAPAEREPGNFSDLWEQSLELFLKGKGCHGAIS